MRKQEIIEHWGNITADQEIAMSAVAYKHKGSTYDQDSIRLTGSKRFIDGVLSKLKELLGYESDETRLQLTYQETIDRETKTPTGTYNCYIQVHERGREAIICNAFCSAAKNRSMKREMALTH